MPEPAGAGSTVQLLALREVRGYLRRSHGLGLSVFIGVAYALGSMLLGGMLILARYPGGYSVFFLWGNALGLQPWNYPGLLIEAPWGFVVLPFFATISMVLVSVGVGLGMAVAILLGVQLARSRRGPLGQPVATGTIAGLTPAMIALVTLGACCSTTAAATAGVGLVAQVSGSTTNNLLLNNWFLGAFQIVVVYISLIAQEMLLRIYGNLFSGADPGVVGADPPPIDRRAVASGLLRAVLVAAGITWMLTVLADWTTTSPFTATPGIWANWLIEHLFLGGFGVLAGLSPRSVRQLLLSGIGSPAGTLARGALLLAAWTLGGWVPPPLASAGLEGFGNELLGWFGAPAAMGGVSPAFSSAGSLAFQWTFQYLLLAGFAAFAALRPRALLDWMTGPVTATMEPPARRGRPAVAPPD